MENRSVLQWDKDDCAAAGLVKFDLLGLGMLTMLHLAVDLVREHEGVDVDLATIPQEPEVYDAAVRGRHHRRVPGGEPRPDGHAAAPAAREASTTWWWRSRSSVPGRSRAARCTPTCGAATARSRSPTRTRCSEQCLEKTLGVPLFQEQLMQMAIDVAGFTAGGVRPAAPGDGVEAVARADGGDARAAARGDGRARHHRRGRRRHRAQDRGLRRLRLPREPLGELRLPRVLELVDQAALPDRVRVRVAQRATDGLLLTAHHRARRDAVTASRCSARVVDASRRDCTLEPRTAAAGPIGRPGPGWHADPSIHAVRVGLRYVRGLQRRAARSHRRRARRAALRRPRGLHPPHRRAHRRARGARHRGRVRVLRASAPAARRCGPPARSRDARGPTSCRAWSPGPTRRRCRA